MSIVIAILAVLIVGTFITKYHPIFKPKQSLAEGEILIPDTAPEVTATPEPTPIEEPVVEAVKKIKKVDTVATKPKKPKTQVTKNK